VSLHIVVMCTANRCRSPIGEVVLASALASADVEAEVRSVGVMSGGIPAVEDAVAVVGERGLDLTSHSSSQVDGSVLEWADLVLTMERSHVRQLATVDPNALGKAFTWREFVRRGESSPPNGSQSVSDWVRLLALGRDPKSLLRPSTSDDIADPIGKPRKAFVAVADELTELSERTARLLS
jgi:protein-tyrosine phosphatase